MHINGELFMDGATFRRVAKAEFAREATAIRAYASVTVVLAFTSIVLGMPTVGGVFGFICLMIMIFAPDAVLNSATRKYLRVGPTVWRYELDDRSFRIIGPFGPGEGRWSRFTEVTETDELWLVRPRFGRRFVGLPKAAFSDGDRAALAAFLGGKQSSIVPA